MVCGYELPMLEADTPKVSKFEKLRDELLAYVQYLRAIVKGSKEQERQRALEGKTCYNVNLYYPKCDLVMPKRRRWASPFMQSLEDEKEYLIQEIIFMVALRFCFEEN